MATRLRTVAPLKVPDALQGPRDDVRGGQTIMTSWQRKSRNLKDKVKQLERQDTDMHRSPMVLNKIPKVQETLLRPRDK
jgi:hypothetical protein